MRWIVVALACSACASTPAKDNFGNPFAPDVAKEVRLFVIDAQSCTHFAGEGPTGEPERDRYLERMINETCTNIAERKADLLSRYGGSDKVRNIIVQAWEE